MLPRRGTGKSKIKSQKLKVIIVEARPIGLSLAVQLIRYGIDFVIFDKKEGITDFSKALIVHAH
ncbi:FAD-dependent monooxygenase [Nostoc sp.]|uniref:FAD-dependent monooxygenase n=1 Tax=Nostoc sp. TaxID=1180 RepID=UPI002FF98BF5